jgi:diaminopimelate decarboxylase
MTIKKDQSKLTIFPETARINESGHLSIGDCDATHLADEFGTPLYVFDEVTIRSQCRQFKNEFTGLYPNTVVAYASKAFLNTTIATLCKEEELGLDVVSGGELSIAHAAEFPLDDVYFHGNNKTRDELKLALEWRTGHIVVDNLYEMGLVDELAGEMHITQPVLLRVTPGIDAHTHRFTTTGLLDSKFGFPLATGQAEQAVAQTMTASNLDLQGLHFHLGSPIGETSPYKLALDLILKFAVDMKGKYGFDLKKLSPGGGFAVRYTTSASIPTIAEYAEVITGSIKTGAGLHKLALPQLIIEPGRAIIAQAGVALYSAGAIKAIPGVRNYVCVDGGMGDNIRPALYGSEYEVLLANKANKEETVEVTIAGKYCESGDILAKDVLLPSVEPGDLIAIPVSGAYCIPMSSNYNMVPRPAIAMVKDGKARLIRKRESYQDLNRLDIL